MFSGLEVSVPLPEVRHTVLGSFWSPAALLLAPILAPPVGCSDEIPEIQEMPLRGVEPVDR
jgi:hypothetical protein